MNPLVTLCSLVLFATVAHSAFPELPLPPGFPQPADQFFPPPPFGESPCGQKWDCANNCTKEKKAFDACCASNDTFFQPANQHQNISCSYKCPSFEHTYRRCLMMCQPKPKACPVNLALPKDFCNKACKHGRFHHFEDKQCALTMSMVSPMCKPYCQYDKHCPNDEKCCPTACATSCQKPV